MDLVAGTEKIVVTMKHKTKRGEIKILRDCTYPLTGAKCVDALVTEKAVFKWNKKGKMILTDVSKESSLEDIRANTEAIYVISDDLKQF